MKSIYLVAGGDARPTINQRAWPAQYATEAKLVAAVERLGLPVRRAHGFELSKRHGFIDSQKRGLDTIHSLPEEASVIAFPASAEHSYHLSTGLSRHPGPILTVGQWTGVRPGIAGMLNLNASLTKLGRKYSCLWSETFEDEFFTVGLRQWLDRGKFKHEAGHLRPFDLKPKEAPADLGDAMRTGRDFARRLRQEGTVLGMVDEGCRGGSQAGAPEALLREAGIFKEPLSRAALWAKAAAVGDEEVRAVLDWFVQRGLRFHHGPDEAADLTEAQILGQGRLYVASARLADEFGCGAFSVQAVPGVAAVASVAGLVEGTFNSVERPPVFHETTGDELFPGEALPFSSQADAGSGLDGLVTYRLWRELGYAPETVAYELRWGRDYRDETTDAFVWIWMVAGGAPPAHFGGWERASSERQPSADSPVGDGTLKGIAKPGWIVWSRVFVEDEKRLCCDAGIAEVISLPVTETEDRWQQTTAQWPLMHVVLQGVSRDQMLARHQGAQVQVVYAPDKEGARRGLFAKAAALRELGVEVCICGNISGER